MVSISLQIRFTAVSDAFWRERPAFGFRSLAPLSGASRVTRSVNRKCRFFSLAGLPLPAQSHLIFCISPVHARVKPIHLCKASKVLCEVTVRLCSERLLRAGAVVMTVWLREHRQGLQGVSRLLTLYGLLTGVVRRKREWGPKRAPTLRFR